jgi:hypothetical protein
MSTPTPARRNGKTLGKPACRHAPNCEVALLQGDLKTQVQGVSEALGLVLEQLEQQGTRLEAWRQETAAQIAEVRERQTVGDQREERYLEELGQVTRSMAQASVRAVREELTPLVQAEVERQLMTRPRKGKGKKAA